jgi:hypothetical protein
MKILNISSLVESAAPDLEHEGFQALDTIHDALQSSMFAAGEHVDRFIMPRRYDLDVLLDFWTATTPLEIYWTARLDQIKQSEFARLICCGLLERRIGRHQHESFDQQISESCVLLTRFLLEEYSCESQGACKAFYSMNGYDFSWASSGRSNQRREMESLIMAPKMSVLSDYHTQIGPSEDYRDTLLAIFDAKQLFVGNMSRFAGDKFRSFQIALPLQHAICGHKTVFSSSFKRRRADLQLICFDPSLTGDENTNHRFLDLSVRLTGYMLEFCTATPDLSELYMYVSHSSKILFAGTLQQRQECLKLIIQEVWQNPNNQLDAWGQLFLLACVKKHFSPYWKIVASKDGKEAGKITDGADFVLSPTSSESPQQPTRPSVPYSASPSKHPSAKAQPHLQPDP